MYATLSFQLCLSLDVSGWKTTSLSRTRFDIGSYTLQRHMLAEHCDIDESSPSHFLPVFPDSLTPALSILPFHPVYYTLSCGQIGRMPWSAS